MWLVSAIMMKDKRDNNSTAFVESFNKKVWLFSVIAFKIVTSLCWINMNQLSRTLMSWLRDRIPPSHSFLDNDASSDVMKEL